MLCRNPDIKTVCITSPTYAGVLSNIGAISRVVHAHGGKLFVDGAHGAHLPFLGLAPFWEADIFLSQPGPLQPDGLQVQEGQGVESRPVTAPVHEHSTALR